MSTSILFICNDDVKSRRPDDDRRRRQTRAPIVRQLRRAQSSLSLSYNISYYFVSPVFTGRFLLLLLLLLLCTQ